VCGAQCWAQSQHEREQIVARIGSLQREIAAQEVSFARRRSMGHGINNVEAYS